MASKGAAFSFLPSGNSKTIAGAQSASASASQFVNQRVAGLVNGTSAEVGGATAQPVGLQDPSSYSRVGDDNSVSASTARRMQSIKDSTARLTQYAALKKANQMSMAQSAAGGSGAAPTGSRGVAVRKGGSAPSVPQGNMAGAGKAYTPSGSLSGVRNQVLADASKYIGTRYVLGGTSTKGIDCSGLIMMVYNKLGYKLPHHSGVQGRTMPGVRTSLSNLRPGDIVAWKDGSHIGIYAGGGYIIDAANRTINTSKRKINMNRSDVYGIALRLPGE